MQVTDLSAAAEKAADRNIFDIIDEKKDANARDAIRNSLHTAAGAVLWTAASILFPPVGLGALAATGAMLYATWFGWDLLKNAAAEHSLDKAKKEATEDPTFEKTAARAEKNQKSNDRWGNALFAAMGVTVVSLLAVAVAPASLLAAVAAPLLMPSLVVGLVAATGSVLTRGSAGAARAIARIGQGLHLLKKTNELQEEAAKLKGPSPVANAPSPSASFDQAANSNTPPAPEAKEPAPVVKPDVPKAPGA